MKGFEYDGRPLPEHAPFPRSRHAPPPPPAPMRTGAVKCRLCSAPIVWVTMEGTGKRMPCDTTQRRGDGTVHLITRHDAGDQLIGRMHAYASADVLGFEPHWGTCPVYREQQRKKREAKEREIAPPEPKQPRTSAEPDLFGQVEEPEGHRAAVRSSDRLTAAEVSILEALARGPAGEATLADELGLSPLVVATELWNLADVRRFRNALAFRDPALRDLRGDALIQITAAGREALRALSPEKP